MSGALEDLIERYVRAWNDPDTERRTRVLETLYTDDGSVVTQSNLFEGLEAVIGHIDDVFDEFIGSGRYVFRSGGVVGHHHCVLFRWELVERDNGQLADAGMNTLLLSPQGRIAGDYQFVLGIDSSIGSMAESEQ